MSDLKSKLTLEEDICIHIFTVSAAMVGVCLTVIGLIRIVITLEKANTFADDLLCGDALLFLISCMLSYWALRTRKVRRMHGLERLADGVHLGDGADDGGLPVHHLRRGDGGVIIVNQGAFKKHGRARRLISNQRLFVVGHYKAFAFGKDSVAFSLQAFSQLGHAAGEFEV